MTKLTVFRNKTVPAPIPQNSGGVQRVMIDIHAEAITSVVAAGVLMVGDMEIEQGIKIDGQIKGSVVFGTKDGLCIVDRTGYIEGSLIGPRALIKGRIDGVIHVHGEVVLAPGAIVNGDVHYGRISLRDGAQINGRMYSITQKDAASTDVASTDSTPTPGLGAAPEPAAA